MSYQDFLARKVSTVQRSGIEASSLPPQMKPHQADATAFALRIGRAGMYLDCLAGETKLNTPYGDVRIDAASSAGLPLMVYAMHPDRGRVVASATPPFRKGSARLYRVKTASGREIVVTERHQFLTSSGWMLCAELRPWFGPSFMRRFPSSVHCGTRPFSVTARCSEFRANTRRLFG